MASLIYFNWDDLTSFPTNWILMHLFLLGPVYEEFPSCPVESLVFSRLVFYFSCYSVRLKKNTKKKKRMQAARGS